MSQEQTESDPGKDDIPVASVVHDDDFLRQIAVNLKIEFETYSKFFDQNIDKEVRSLLNVEKWFQDKKQRLAWKENYDTIEKVRVVFEKVIVNINSNQLLPVNPGSLEDELEPSQLCNKLKGWFRKLLELHFGLRARQLRSRKKYKLFYEHRITNAIVEHIMDEPGVNEAFAHFQSLLRQCGAL
jgi:hypothetical protein